jgi:probable F420-dependent oxidoreductase
MKFGVTVFQIAPAAIAAIAHKAEETGFESLWVPEHLIFPVEYKSRYPYGSTGRMPGLAGAPMHDPMVVLAYVAALTTRIKLATGVFVVPLRNAIATAKSIASLDVLSGGRFLFGIGVGWLAEEFERVGMDFHDRARRTREYVALMKQLWTSEDPVFHGRTINLEGVKFAPKPVQTCPPLIFGGHSEASFKRAAQLGDGWYGIGHSIEELERTIARLREHERLAKRERPLEVTVALRHGRQLTLDDVKRMAAIGVDRMLVGGPQPTQEMLASIEHLGAELVAKV